MGRLSFSFGASGRSPSPYRPSFRRSSSFARNIQITFLAIVIHVFTNPVDLVLVVEISSCGGGEGDSSASLPPSHLLGGGGQIFIYFNIIYIKYNIMMINIRISTDIGQFLGQGQQRDRNAVSFVPQLADRCF